MKKYKQIYEIFKKSDKLSEMDKKFIEISEKLLSQSPKNSKIVYSEPWLYSWIKTSMSLMFVKDVIDRIILDDKNEIFTYNK